MATGTETVLPRQEKRPEGDFITIFSHCYYTDDGDQMVFVSTKENIENGLKLRHKKTPVLKKGLNG